jgi:hypothetical protein
VKVTVNARRRSQILHDIECVGCRLALSETSSILKRLSDEENGVDRAKIDGEMMTKK